MSFEIAESVIRSTIKIQYPVAVSLRPTTGLPQLFVTLTQDFAVQAKIAPGERFELMIGSHQHKGLIMLVRDPDGRFVSYAGSKGGIRIYCGCVAKLGAIPRKRERCKVRIIADGEIEIRLPDAWMHRERETSPPLRIAASNEIPVKTATMIAEAAERRERRKRLGM